MAGLHCLFLSLVKHNQPNIQFVQRKKGGDIEMVVRIIMRMEQVGAVDHGYTYCSLLVSSDLTNR